MGFHEYDDRFEDLSKQAIVERIRQLTRLQIEYIALDQKKLSVDEAIDGAVLAGPD